MNCSDIPQQRRTRAAWGWWLLLVPAAFLVAIFVGLALVVTSFFRLSQDARCLRNSVRQFAQTEAVNWNERIELRLGSIPCFLLRAGLSFAPLNEEARAAVQALRGAEVGIYQLDAGAADLDRGAMLSAVDKAMASRGWDRLVGVAKGREVVAVYVPQGEQFGSRLDACVAVLSRRELIIAAARTDLEPLIEFAMSRPEWKEQRWLSSHQQLSFCDARSR